MTIGENKCNVFYNAEIKAVVMEWDGYANSAQFREGTEWMLNELIKNNCDKVLADIKGMSMIGSEDQKWLESTFLPRALKFGFKKIAIVKPETYFSYVAIETISAKIDKRQISLNVFETTREAEEWLKAGKHQINIIDN